MSIKSMLLSSAARMDVPKPRRRRFLTDLDLRTIISSREDADQAARLLYNRGIVDSSGEWMHDWMLEPFNDGCPPCGDEIDWKAGGIDPGKFTAAGFSLTDIAQGMIVLYSGRQNGKTAAMNVHMEVLNRTTVINPRCPAAKQIPRAD